MTLSKDKFTTYVTATKFKGEDARGKVSRPLLQKFTSIGSADEGREFERNLDIGSIDRIQAGQNTLRFERANHVKRKGTKIKELPLNDSFSIIFNSERTLDFVVREQGISRDEIVEIFLVVRTDINSKTGI